MSRIILFDLDGTLTDSAEGIVKSVQYALAHSIRISIHRKTEMLCGDRLFWNSLCSTVTCQSGRRRRRWRVYRERYAKTGIYENRLYEGIPQLLELLKQEKKILGVASSKPEIYVRRILEYFQIDQYFDVIVGANMDGTRTKKSEVIEEALERLQAEESREEVLMVGDRFHDVAGALECGIQCIGAAYGYGGEAELRKAGAVYLARSVEELKILSDRYRKSSDAGNRAGRKGGRIGGDRCKKYGGCFILSASITASPLLWFRWRRFSCLAGIICSKAV